MCYVTCLRTAPLPFVPYIIGVYTGRPLLPSSSRLLPSNLALSGKYVHITMQTDEKHDMAFVLPTESRNTPSSEGNNSLKERTISSNGIVRAPENGLSEESTAPALKGFGRADPAQVHLHQQAGINRIEAFHRTFGRNSIVSWMLYASLLLTSMAYVFDQSSTFKYLTFATSYFEASEYIGTISTAQSIISACPALN